MNKNSPVSLLGSLQRNGFCLLWENDASKYFLFQASRLFVVSIIGYWWQDDICRTRLLTTLSQTKKCGAGGFVDLRTVRVWWTLYISISVVLVFFDVITEFVDYFSYCSVLCDYWCGNGGRFFVMNWVPKAMKSALKMFPTNSGPLSVSMRSQMPYGMIQAHRKDTQNVGCSPLLCQSCRRLFWICVGCNAGESWVVLRLGERPNYFYRNELERPLRWDRQERSLIRMLASMSVTVRTILGITIDVARHMGPIKELSHRVLHTFSSRVSVQWRVMGMVEYGMSKWLRYDMLLRTIQPWSSW